MFWDTRAPSRVGFRGQYVRMPDPTELVGCFTVEVGERQAWPFITFCDNRGSKSREVRLYLDTSYSVRSPNGDASLEGTVYDLLELNNLLVDAVEVSEDALVITWAGGFRLQVSNVAEPQTTGDVWWLSPWLA